MNMRYAAAVLAATAAFGLARLGAQPAGPVTIGVAADRPGAAIASTMYGVFFEDINFGADGGIYAEKIKNRSFEFPDPLMGWKRAAVDGASGTFAIETAAPPSPANTHYLRIAGRAGRFGVTNDGFRGIGVRKAERHTVRLLARRRSPAPVSLVVEFEAAVSALPGRAIVTASIGRNLGPGFMDFARMLLETDRIHAARRADELAGAVSAHVEAGLSVPLATAAVGVLRAAATAWHHVVAPPIGASPDALAAFLADHLEDGRQASASVPTDARR